MAIVVKMIDITKYAEWLTKADLKKAAEALLQAQHKRITSGIGQRGQPMKRLSKAYAARVGRTIRTLNVTGRLLRSRRVVSGDTEIGVSATIGFGGNAPVYAFINQYRTPFLGPTPKERALFVNAVKKMVKLRIKKNNSKVKASKR